MLNKILGILFLLLGILFFLKPHLFLRWIQRKAHKRLKVLLFGILFSLGGGLLKIGFSQPGWPAKVLMFVGLILLIKGIFILKAKAFQHILEISSRIPIKVYRISSLLYILLGLYLLYGLKK